MISDIVDCKMTRIRENDHEILKSQNGLTISRAPFFSEQFSIFLAGTFSGWEIGTLAGSLVLTSLFLRRWLSGP